MKQTYKLKDFAQDVSIAVKDAKSSPYNRFVGLEHYDSGEPVITRFTDTSLLSSSVKEFHANDILIARRNVYLRRAGIVYFDGLTSGDSIVLRVYDDCAQRTGINKEDAIMFLPFILNSNDFWAYANKHADGMNSKRISKEMLYDYQFSLPPLSEQKILAEKLWAAYRLKEAYKKLLVATDEMVKAKFMEMIKKAKSFDTLESVCLYLGKGITPKYVEQSSAVVINQACIYWDGLRLDNIKYHNTDVSVKKRLLQTGDVLLNATGNGTLGRSCIFKRPSDDNIYINDSHVISIETNRELILPEVLNSYFALPDTQGEIYRKYVTGSTNQSDIVFTELKQMPIPLPDMSEQVDFVKILNQAEKSKTSLLKSIESIDSVIKSLINNPILKPSESALEWAKSIGIKGDVKVPLDEDGRSWRYDKYCNPKG